jgi:hypothetical protein
MNETQHPGPLEFRFSDELGRIAKGSAELATLQDSLRRLGVRMTVGLAVVQIQTREVMRNCEDLQRNPTARATPTKD